MLLVSVTLLSESAVGRVHVWRLLNNRFIGCFMPSFLFPSHSWQGVALVAFLSNDFGAIPFLAAPCHLNLLHSWQKLAYAFMYDDTSAMAFLVARRYPPLSHSWRGVASILAELMAGDESVVLASNQS